MDRATDFRMNEGFCVPIHSSEGFQAVVTMAGERVEAARQVRRALHLMALYAYGKAVELWSPKRFPAAASSHQARAGSSAMDRRRQDRVGNLSNPGRRRIHDYRPSEIRRRQVRHPQSRRHRRRRAASLRNLSLIRQFLEIGIRLADRAVEHRFRLMRKDGPCSTFTSSPAPIVTSMSASSTSIITYATASMSRN